MAKFDVEGSRLRAKDSDGNEYFVSSMDVVESLFAPTEITVGLMAEAFSPQDIVGKCVTCSVYDEPSGDAELVREFEGYVVNVTNHELVQDDSGGTIHYTLSLLSWLGLLRYTKNYRVFQEQSTKDIITEIVEEAGFGGLTTYLDTPTTVRPYCVQYGESDYDFICRLLSEEGVTFYFEQKTGAHNLIIQDAAGTFTSMESPDCMYATDPVPDVGVISTWNYTYSFHGGGASLSNYDYETTSYIRSSTATTADTLANHPGLVSFSFGEPTVSGELENLSGDLLDRRLGAIESNYAVIRGESSITGMSISELFNLNGHYDESQTGEYRLIQVSHSYSGEPFSYTNGFGCISSSRAYYPPLLRKPTPPSITTGVIAGTELGQPSQDADGRVYVRFQWDETEGDSPSGWVRVAQAFAGKSYGAQFIPRAGDEVLVGFLDEDIDRPVVMGSVYNSQNPVLYPIANTTQSGFRTGLSGESNEIRFDDKEEAELFYFHAAKDMTVEVEENYEQTIKGELSRTIEEAAVTTAKTTYALNVTESLTETGKTIVMEADDSIEIKVGSSSVVLNSGGVTINGTKIETTSDGATNIKAGAALALDGGTSAALEAPSGVTVSSQAKVTVKGTAGVSVTSSAMTEVTGSAQTTISGGIVSIN